MAPKANCNPLKLTQMVNWLQKSRAVWTIKELEKSLASVASINSMQVKDYVQNLQDDNKISCEKIGSGNWYFSFPSQAKRNADHSLATVQKEHEKVSAVVKDMRHKLAEKAAQLEEEQGGAGEDRDEIIQKKAILEADLLALRKELEAYSDNDPTELERKKVECGEFFEQAEQYTDDICAMESYLKKMGAGAEEISTLQVGVYGDEFDTEERCLRELARPELST